MDNNTIHTRFDPAKNHEAILFRQDKVLQSAELNDAQAMAAHRLRGIADALFRDGDVVRDARIIVNADTGAVQAEAGAIYLKGAVRGIPPGAFSVPVVGVVNVGIYLQTSIATELTDPDLLNPAAGTPSYQQPGAWRQVVTPAWGRAGDGQAGEFFAVYVVEDGYLRGKEPPPNLDAVTQALARYDRDSAGDGYIVSGLAVATAANLGTGEQVYTVSEGRARVNGYGVELAASRRLVYATGPDIKLIDSEAHYSATEGAQRINVYRAPMRGAPQVRIQSRRTVDVVHGGFGGAADALPDAAVIAINEVKQGGTTYHAPADYKLTAGQVDWSPAGAEPAVGSTYQVTYTYMRVAVPTGVDATGFDVSGALEGTMVLVTYEQMLRRVDRLCLDAEGVFRWVRGISAEWSPAPPNVPPSMLLLASVYQSWDTNRRVVQDGVRVVRQDKLVDYGRRLDALAEDQAELRLAVDVSGRDAGIRKGLFADPFVSDAMRDAGVPQTGAIVGGALRLPVAVAVHQLGLDLQTRQAPDHGWRTLVQQQRRTGSMLVNPYQAFDPLPAAITLTPHVDRWTEVDTQWTSPVTNRLYTGSGGASYYTGATGSVKLISETSTELEHLRQIAVRFDIAGFGPGEVLSSVTFDGVDVEPAPLAGSTLAANAQGLLAGTFEVPADVPAGAKEVVFMGTGGTRGAALFTGQGTAVTRVQQQVTNENWQNYDPNPAPSGGGDFVVGPSGRGGGGAVTNRSPSCSTAYEMFGGGDPLAQTFTLDADTQCAGIDLVFTAKGTSDVLVELRETQSGLPTGALVLAHRVPSSAIQLDAETRIAWPPVMLQAAREYAVVIGTDDAVTALAIAELGKWDTATGAYVTGQPYQIGVLLSSANANTWTPHQDRDLVFRLLGPAYTQAERVIELGTATLEGATDLMVMGHAERPAADTPAVFELVFEGGQVLQLADGQVVWLAEPYTGEVQVRARLGANATLGAVLQPGVQLIAGAIAPTGDYVSRWLGAGGASSRLKVVFQAEIPSGSAVHVHAQTDAPGAPWVLVPYVSASEATAGVREFTHELPEFAGARVRVRLTLTGGTAARPTVGNLRAVVL